MHVGTATDPPLRDNHGGRNQQRPVNPGGGSYLSPGNDGATWTMATVFVAPHREWVVTILTTGPPELVNRYNTILHSPRWKTDKQTVNHRQIAVFATANTSTGIVQRIRLQAAE